MRLAVTLCLTFFPLLAAAETEGYFSYNDWEVLCDNTRTCRAAGYTLSGEDNHREMLSVLLTREAGPEKPVTIEIISIMLDSGDANTGSLFMTINNGEPEQIAKYRLNPPQTQAFLSALRDKDTITFISNGRSIVLSLQGSRTVLLKMDDVQGRIGTQSALIRRGNRDEKEVLPALPVPIIYPAKTQKVSWRTLSSKDTTLLRSTLIATLGEDRHCDYLEENSDKTLSPLSTTVLDSHNMLVRALCWRGANSEGYGYWVVDRALKTVPLLITDSGSYYASGRITLNQRGHGIGECWTNTEWIWDGKTFQKSKDSITGMYRGISGGIWSLKSHVAQVSIR